MIKEIKNQDNVFFCNGDNEFYYPDWFLNRKIICGNEMMEFFYKFLKLKILTIGLNKIIWQFNYFKFYFFDKNGVETVILIKRKDNATDKEKYSLVISVNIPWLILSENNYLSDEYKIILLKLKTIFARTKPHLLFMKIFKDKSNMIVDCLSTDIKYELLQKQKIESLTEFPFYEWGNPLIKYLFFLQTMIKKKKSTGLDIESTGIDYSIEHADYECSNMSKEHLINHSYILNSDKQKKRVDLNDFINKFKNKETIRNFKNKDHKQIISNLNDNDIILGATNKLKVFLQEIIKDKKNPGIYINTCCTPLIIGDDIKSLKKEYEQKYNIKISYQDPIFDNTGLNNFEYIKELFKKHENRINNDKNEKLINIVGFLPSQATFEIFSALKIFNININTALIPKFKEELIEKYFRAGVQVLFDNHEYQFLYNDIFKNLKIPYLLPEAPYGFKKTTEFIKKIALFFNHDLENKKWIDYNGKLEKSWQALQAQAKEQRLGIIFSDNDIASIIKPNKFLFSAPILALLDEMGFSLDILIYTVIDKYDYYKEKIAQMLPDNDYTFKFCSAYDELENWLASNNFSAVYSDLRFDNRLAKFGKNSFNVFDFEMGYQGAIRSLEKILNKCHDDFYRKYFEYFSYEPKAIIFEEN